MIIDFLRHEKWKSREIKGYSQVRVMDWREVARIPLSFSQERLWIVDQTGAVFNAIRLLFYSSKEVQ